MSEAQILRLPDVTAKCGLSRSTIYELVKRGEFPKPIHLTARAVGWQLEAVNAWVARRVEASQSKAVVAHG